MQSAFCLMVPLLFGTLVFGQGHPDMEKFGFINIKTDSMDVPFFIDGIYVGNHPLKGVVPVLPGFHEVSYVHPDIQKKKIRDNLSDGIKRVYVAPNDTLEVFLFYDHYLAQVETLHKEIQIQNYVGLTLALVLVYIIFSIF